MTSHRYRGPVLTDTPDGIAAAAGPAVNVRAPSERRAASEARRRIATHGGTY